MEARGAEPRRGRATAAGDIALGEGAGALARAGFADAGLVLRWAEIAGAEVARAAQPVKFSEGPEGATLTLRCRPGAAVFLQHETRALTGRLNAYLGRGRIARLRFVTGDLGAPPELPPHPGGGDNSQAPANLDEALNRLMRRRKRPRNAGCRSGD